MRRVRGVGARPAYFITTGRPFFLRQHHPGPLTDSGPYQPAGKRDLQRRGAFLVGATYARYSRLLEIRAPCISWFLTGLPIPGFSTACYKERREEERSQPRPVRRKSPKPCRTPRLPSDAGVTGFRPVQGAEDFTNVGVSPKTGRFPGSPGLAAHVRDVAGITPGVTFPENPGYPVLREVRYSPSFLSVYRMWSLSHSLMSLLTSLVGTSSPFFSWISIPLTLRANPSCLRL